MGGVGRSQFTADHSQGTLGPGPQLRQGAGGGHAQPRPVSPPLPGAGACALGPPSLIQNHQCRPFRVSGNGTLLDRVALGQGGGAAPWGQAAGGTTVSSETSRGSLSCLASTSLWTSVAAFPGNLESLKCVSVGFQFGCSSPSRKRNAPMHLSRNQTTKEEMVWAGVLAARVRQLDLGAMAPACQAFPWPWGGGCVPSFRPLCSHSPTQSAAALAQQTKAHGSSCYTHTSEVTAKRARTVEATANRPVTHQATGAGGRSSRWPCPGTRPPAL